MIDFILFEKKSENDRPVWTEDLVKTFCEDQKISPREIKEETLFYVVRVVDGEDDPDQHYRMLEVTETITFIMKDDPALNEFMELGVPPLQELKINDDEKEA
jgi:hypothetical protein